MNSQTLKLLKDVNQAIIKFRSVYSAWSKNHGISYNEMLILYTIRDNGFCTQKQICDSYLLPKQTIHNVISTMCKNGLLCESSENSAGRRKAFTFTDKGKVYAASLVDSIGKLEEKAVMTMGEEKVRQMTALVCEYDGFLMMALEEAK